MEERGGGCYTTRHGSAPKSLSEDSGMENLIYADTLRGSGDLVGW